MIVVYRMPRGHTDGSCMECKGIAHVMVEIGRLQMRLCMQDFRELQKQVNQNHELTSSPKPKR